jgi:hypothetical protein
VLGLTNGLHVIIFIRYFAQYFLGPNHSRMSIHPAGKVLDSADKIHNFHLLVESFFDSSFAQENMTTATNETSAMMSGNHTNQTGGNQTQQEPLEQLGETLGGVFGGGNQSQ